MNKTHERFQKKDVELESKKLELAHNFMLRSFEFETTLYENDHRQSRETDDDIFDTRIFPYHPSCYLLLDMYMCTEYEGDFPYDIPYRVGVAARNDDIYMYERNFDHNDGFCYLPCSTFSSFLTLMGPSMAPEYWNFVSSILVNDDYDDALVESAYMMYIQEIIQRFTKERIAWMNCEHDFAISSEKQEGYLTTNQAIHQLFGCDCNFEIGLDHVSPGIRTKTLLKLFKHSISDLQGDYRLAITVMLAFIRYKCFDGAEGVDAFRFFLVALESEFILDCGANHSVRDPNDVRVDSECHLPHNCNDFHMFLRCIGHIIQMGIEHMTETHAISICSFLNRIFDQESWKEVDDMNELNGWDPEEPETPSRTTLIISLLRGLVGHNNILRFRLTTLLRQKYSGDHTIKEYDENIDACAASHGYCIQALLSISDSVLRRLPANPVTASVGSLLLGSLALSCIVPMPWDRYKKWYPSYDPFFFVAGMLDGAYIGRIYNSSSLVNGRSIMDVQRYAECIRNASNRYHTRLDALKTDIGITESHNFDIENDVFFRQFYLVPSSLEMVTIVKGLFLRQLVETNEAGLGYGDFLIYADAEVVPFDEMLFEHEMNYPIENGFYDGIEILSESGGKEDTDYFFKSEENINLTTKYVRSRYDMSLLLLRREWEKSWTPESHLSFHSPYRQALQTMTLIAHRHGFPLDLCRAVNSFLQRDWWYDERRSCWKYECQVSSVQSALDNNRVGASKHLVICSSCMLASACSRKHLSIIHHEGHRRPCGLPPMRVPTDEDVRFCDNYKKFEYNDGTTISESNDDWESDDSSSNADLSGTRTYRILRYFKHYYISQKRESFAFERYYSEE